MVLADVKASVFGIGAYCFITIQYRDMSLGLELALVHSCIHFLYFLVTVVIRSVLPQHAELTALKSWSVNLPPFKLSSGI